MTLPAFIGIGAQKCATTWLAQVIAHHPQLFMAEGKEIDFWSAHFHMGYSWYEAAFDDARDRRAGEISPSYLVDHEAPERLFAKLPKCQIILALRDPVDRAFSNHLHQLRKGHYRGGDQSFEAGLADNPMLIEQSRYGRHLKRWLEFFPLEQFHVIYQENIASNAAGEASLLYQFLNADAAWQNAVLGERTHENVGHRSAALRDGLRLFGRAARRMGLGGMANLAKRSPGLGTIYQANRQDFRLIIDRPARGLRLELAKSLAQDMAELAGLLGEDELPWTSWQMLKNG